jgi:hypothetical protein
VLFDLYWHKEPNKVKFAVECVHNMGTAVNHKKIRMWYELFRNGRTSLVDEHRPGRPVEAAAPDTAQPAN